MSLTHTTAALLLVGELLNHGDEKYGPGQWLENKKPDDVNLQDHIEAIERHLQRYKAGEWVDESGNLALAHIVGRALMALTFQDRLHRRGVCLHHAAAPDGTLYVCTDLPSHPGAFHQDYKGAFK